MNVPRRLSCELVHAPDLRIFEHDEPSEMPEPLALCALRPEKLNLSLSPYLTLTVGTPLERTK